MNSVCWSQGLQPKTGDLYKGESQNKISIKEIQQCEGVDSLQWAQAGFCGHEPVASIKYRKIFDQLSDFQFHKGLMSRYKFR
jgi:hypothetical protein